MFVQEALQTSSLENLGVLLLDGVDQAIQDGEPENIETIYQEIGQEVLRRVPDPVKLEAMLDFHYNKFKKSVVNREENGGPYYEFKAVMAGFNEFYSAEHEDNV